MDSIDDRGPAKPCPHPFNLADHVLWRNGAADNKTAMAVVSADGAARWSYGRLRGAVLNAAGRLLANGIAPGDRILLRLGNSPDFPVFYLGAIAADIIPVPVSASLTEAEVARIEAAVRPKLIVGSGGVSPDELAEANPLEAPRTGNPDRIAYIIFTSGTSGTPMGVVHAHRAIWARRSMIEGWYELGPGDRMMHAGAFNWTYTLGTGLCDPWTMGATALVPATGTDIATLPLLMKRFDATIFAAAPGVFRRLLRGTLPALPKLRHALSAGEKLPDQLALGWSDATGTAIYEAFGQSECSTFISGSPAMPAPPQTLGYTQPGRKVAILVDGTPVPRGEPGDIAIAASDPGVMLGYLDAPKATDRRHTGPWFLTGDVGAMGKDGAITYIGRRDDIMTAGGYRISPVEVENAMLLHPALTDAAAVDERLDADTTVIALHYTADAPVPKAELATHAAQHLARYKCPRVFHHCESLPRSAGGKLLRRRLRAEIQKK